MLVIANEPLLGDLVDLGRRANLVVHVCTTPSEATQLLERSGNRLACAIIASSAAWGVELRRLITQNYPEIDRFTVVV
jgi:hypothetical protein